MGMLKLNVKGHQRCQSYLGLSGYKIIWSQILVIQNRKTTNISAFFTKIDATVKISILSKIIFQWKYLVLVILFCSIRLVELGFQE